MKNMNHGGSGIHRSGLEFVVFLFFLLL